MAYVLADDLDGTTRDVKTVKFNLDGINYEIDLSPEHEAALRKVFLPYTKKGRELDRPPVAASPVGMIRQWANAHGYKLADRGQIPAKVMQAFLAAHK